MQLFLKSTNQILNRINTVCGIEVQLDPERYDQNNRLAPPPFGLLLPLPHLGNSGSATDSVIYRGTMYETEVIDIV